MGALFLTPLFARAQQPLGELKLTDSFVESFFEVREAQEAEFDLRNTYVGFGWHYEDLFRSRLVIGQESLLGVASRYGGTTAESEDFAVVEAYTSVEGDYGEISFGLIPIDFGLEGGGRESELFFSRALFYQAGGFGLRDFGVSYRVQNKSFYTQLFVHNGEGGSEKDNRTWITSVWGWHRGHWLLGFSGTTGQTTPESTFRLNQASSDTVFDPEENADWRIGSLQVQYVDHYLAVRLEGFAGKVQQEVDGKNEFFAGYLAITRKISQEMTLGLRYDTLEPDRDLSGDQFSEVTFAVAWHNVYQTSSLYLEMIKSLQANTGVFDDRLRLIWRLTPLGNAFSERFR